uniref:UV-stimulated scaffold protein A C-terminal domain-containing protein n=1 Tax=Strigamia maritima TaxID=126957 RepID=T1ISH9_STRMM
MEVLDETLCQQLAKTLEDLTTSRPNPQNGGMNTVKRICKQSDGYVKRAFHILMHQLEQDHAEMRVFSLNVIDELFRRSHTFRTELLADFQTFMELTLETDPELPLPPPKAVAKDLKVKTCILIQSWQNIYGNGYKQLELGYRFLRDCKKIDFNEIETRSVAERNREEQQQRQKQLVIQENVRKVLSAMADQQLEIENCITEFNNACSLLLESTDEIFTQDDFQNPQPCCSKTITTNSDVTVENMDNENSQNDCEDDKNLLRLHGLGSHKYNLDLEIGIEKKISIDKNNSVVVINLKNSLKLITKNYLPTVNKWIDVFTKAEECRDQLKKAIDIKQSLQTVIDKYRNLNIIEDSIIDGSESEESDDDFIEVPERVDNEEVKVRSFGFVESSVSDLKDPTTLLANLKALGEKTFHRQFVSRSQSSEGSSKKADVLNKAPSVRFDVDLINWEEKLEPPLTVTRPQGLHRFWQPQENEAVSKPEDANLLRVRRIDFSGNFQPVKWQCRTPLPSGKLCPRFDRCPLHGKVIARDELGNPTQPEDIERVRAEQEKIDKTKPPDWQDPVLLREIEAAIGIDLTVGKKSRKKKKKYLDLTDIKEKITARKRLEKKVLSKSAMKRVSSNLDNTDYKKYRDKFGDQFNYSN